MSEPLSDADKIRNKRLAKLGGGGGGGGGPPASSATSSPKESNGPQQASASALTPQQSSETSPDHNAAGQETSVRDKRIKITPTSATARVPSPLSSSSPAPPKPRVVPKAEESFETFEDRTLRALFSITLDETQQKTIHGQKLTFLPGVLSELRDEGSDVRLSIGILDQAILEAASNTGRDTPLDYLLPCWKRVRRLIKGFRKSSENDPRFNVVSEAKRLCLSYCVFAVTMPEMFGQNPTSRSPLIPNLLVEAEDDRGVDLDFVAEVVKLFEEQEDLKPAIISAVEQMSQELSIKSMNDDYKPYVTALRNLVHNAVIASTIAESSRFLSQTDAASFELDTLLGPYFRLSPLQAPVTTTYFSSPKTRDQGFILNSQRSLRMTQQLLSSDLLDVMNHLIRASKEAREKVLDWFAAAINLNHKRRALQVDPRAVSSDGFMFNITTCLDQLCEPFMDASFSKIDRIDALYLHRNPRVQMRDETKINADQQTSDEFYARKESGTSNFISEVFFLTVAAHHYGSESLTSKLEQLEKDLRHMETQINKFELERHKWIHNPMQLRTYEEALKKYKDRLDLGISLKYSLQGVLFDTTWQTRSMQFMRYVIVWILRLVSGTDFPKQKLSLPLPEEPQEIFKCLPEYFIDDIVSNFKFIMWSMPQIITTAQGDELVMLCIAFLESSQYIKNPYLKAGLISIVFRGTWPRPGGARGILVDLLNSLPFANTYLLHAVMKFYIEVEHTGTHTQFFDKFNIRYEIFQIIKCIWGNPAYRNQLSDQATDNLDFFVRFVNLLLNDVTFVLDEAFTAFITIHDTQELLNRAGNNLEETVRKEKEEALSAAQGRAKSYMQLTNETVAMLKLFTEALADSFTMPEIVQRLADMLDYNLDAMVGPKSSNLHVGNLQEYGFNPRGLLSEIIDVYINLMNKENFIVAVARDGRSYKPQNFEKAAEIIRKRALKSDEELAKLVELARRIKQAKEADDQAEEDLGEIPDDFLDPLIYTLMEDPVILPSSKVTIDRATIRSHLLSDPNDPFNRAPLKIEDVIPNTDLKKQIEDFKAERKAAKLRALKEAEIMDTSAG